MATSIAYLEKMLLSKEVQAALTTIRKCEGTSAPDGYYYLFGSTPKNNIRFTGTAAHPNIKKSYTDKSGKPIITTAAGAYQIIFGTYNMLCRAYKFKDFSPHTQDLMALALFDSENVLKAVSEGRFFESDVMDRLNNQWASLPMAGYNQPEKPIAKVKQWYTEAGGTIIV